VGQPTHYFIAYFLAPPALRDEDQHVRNPHPFMLEIPELTTDRLLLRAFRADDFEAYALMMSDPDVTRFLGEGQALTRADAWRQMAMIVGHWTFRGFGLWAVEERSSGRLLGRIGCHEPEGFPGFEIGYVLAPHAWGKGYAREGAAASLRFARETLGKTSIASFIRPANHASIGVAKSLGAVAGETVDFFGAPSVAYRYPVVATD
jgi:RimJ/RimL family protein N-acetyltransferase